MGAKLRSREIPDITLLDAIGDKHAGAAIEETSKRFQEEVKSRRHYSNANRLENDALRARCKEYEIKCIILQMLSEHKFIDSALLAFGLTLLFVKYNPFPWKRVTGYFLIFGASKVITNQMTLY